MALDTTVAGETTDSYGTLAEYRAYAADMGWTLSGSDQADEANLRRAAQVLDRQYHWRGYRDTEFQARAWPRERVGYVDGWWVDDGFIPQAIKDAQFELAYLIQGGLNPFATIKKSVTRRKTGPIEEEMLPTGRPRIVAIEGMLRPYLRAGAGQAALSRA